MNADDRPTGPRGAAGPAGTPAHADPSAGGGDSARPAAGTPAHGGPPAGIGGPRGAAPPGAARPAAGPPDGASPPEGEPSAGPPLPGLPTRLVQVLFSPGKLTAALAHDPRWLGALLVSAVLVALQMGLIPPEVFAESQRQAALDAGREVVEMPEAAQAAMRIAIPLFSGLATLVLPFVFAGLYAFVFSFLLGDEGRYGQYLAVVAHAWFIPALAGLLLTPLRISTGDPQLSLNLASFMLFLPDGYLLRALRFVDLTQIWSSLVVAQGAHAIDWRRGFPGAAGILIGIQLAFALLLAALLPS